MKEDGLLQKLKSFLTWMKRLIYFTIHSFPGACVSIERAIGEPLMELVVGAMVRFKSNWPDILSKMPNIIERGNEKVHFYMSEIDN